jgi:hypothetical protein
MRTFLGPLFALFFVASLVSGQEEGDVPPAKSPRPEIEFTALGINLYGKFRFESEGELFDIIDNDSKILISSGAVLTCIRRTYTIGYFGGGATIFEDGKSRVIPKVFFILKPSGEITYHSPTPDGNFPGKQLAGSIEFGTLYDSQKNQAEQDGGGQSTSRPESK